VRRCRDSYHHDDGKGADMDNARSTGSSPRGIAPQEAAAEQVRGRGATAPGRRCAAVAIASVGLVAAGCSAVSHAAVAPSATTPGAAATATTPAPKTDPPASPTAPASVATTTSPTAPVSASPAAAVPTLGQPVGLFAHGQGFGQVKPTKIFNGGDPTGLVTQVAWRSWGGAQAIATGISDYVGPNQTVAGGKEESATVVAFNLGICNGRLMYRAVEWYFPQHKQAFDPRRYEDICAGVYVPGS
jgi:hypothetical protein